MEDSLCYMEYNISYYGYIKIEITGLVHPNGLN